MASLPLTHHEILVLVEPFTRRGALGRSVGQRPPRTAAAVQGDRPPRHRNRPARPARDPAARLLPVRQCAADPHTDARRRPAGHAREQRTRHRRAARADRLGRPAQSVHGRGEMRHRALPRAARGGRAGVQRGCGPAGAQPRRGATRRPHAGAHRPGGARDLGRDHSDRIARRPAGAARGPAGGAGLELGPADPHQGRLEDPAAPARLTGAPHPAGRGRAGAGGKPPGADPERAAPRAFTSATSPRAGGRRSDAPSRC